MARQAHRRARRTWPQRLLLAVNVLLVVACLGSAAALTKVRTTLQSVPVVDVGSSLNAQVEVSEPRNFLIIGTDSAARLDRDDPVTKGRVMNGARLADVIMVLRVDPRDGSARLLSIPRDSRVALAPDGRYDRINAAIAGANGPRNLVQTIKRNFGISVDNYVEVDFAAFQDLVEVLRGVPVYFAVPVRDRNTGLMVEEPGCIELGSRQALAYARSRHFEFQDERGRWRTDGTGDLGRITRQQDFIKRALGRASDRGIRNPSTAVGLVDAAASAVVLDDTLSAGTILDLLNQFRSFNPDDLLTEQVPTTSGERGGVAYQDVEWEAARPLLAGFWGIDLAEGTKVDDVIVDVRATSADAEAAATAVAQLDAFGFDAEVLTSRSSTSTTTITYGPDGREAARHLARHLPVVPRAVLDDDIVGPRVVLTVGRDFQGVREQPVGDAELPADYLPAPTTTTAPPVMEDPGAPGDDTTTTTVIEDGAPPDAPPPGVVPTDPERAAACR